jgi:hypothetical protein
LTFVAASNYGHRSTPAVCSKRMTVSTPIVRGFSQANASRMSLRDDHAGPSFAYRHPKDPVAAEIYKVFNESPPWRDGQRRGSWRFSAYLFLVESVSALLDFSLWAHRILRRGRGRLVVLEESAAISSPTGGRTDFERHPETRR